MKRFWTLFLLGVGAVLLGAGLAGLRSNPWLLLLWLPGIAASYLAIKRDNQWEMTVREERQHKAQERIRDVTLSPWKEGEVVRVKGHSYIWAIAFVITVTPIVTGAALTAFTDIALRLLTMLFLYLWLVTRGKPRLELDANGFRTPLHGHIPWGAVNGVALEEIGTRGGINYLLRFRIEDYAKAVAFIPWPVKVMTFFGVGPIRLKNVSIYLGNDGKEPEQETLFGLARYLWQQERAQRAAP